jgi:hypothetical protein
MFHIQENIVDVKSPHLSADTKSAPSPRRIPEDDVASLSLDFPTYIQMKKQRSNLLAFSTDATTMEVLEDEEEMCGFTAQQFLPAETIHSPSCPATEALDNVLQEHYGSSWTKRSGGTRSCGCLVDSLEVEAVLCRDFLNLTAKTFQAPRPHRKKQKGLKRSLRFSELQSLTHRLARTRKSLPLPVDNAVSILSIFPVGL